MRITSHAIIFSALFLAACGGGGSTPAPVGQGPDDITPLSAKISRDASRMKAEQSCPDLNAYLADAITQDYLDSPYCSGFFCVLATVGAAPASQPALPDLVSDTNVQVAGVDEADMVKTDAEGNLYIAFEGQLIIADAFPPTELSELSRLPLSGNNTRLFLIEEQQRAVVITQTVPEPVVTPAVIGGPGNFPRVGLEILFLDVSDLTAPRVTDRLWLPGYSVAERRIDDRLHLVSVKHIEFPRVLSEDAEFAALLSTYGTAKSNGEQGTVDTLSAQIRTFVRDAVNATPLEQMVATAHRTVDGEFAPLDLLACTEIYRPDVPVMLGLTTLVSVDIDGANLDAVAAVATASDVYTSVTNVYLTQSSRGWWWHPQQADQTAIHQFSIAGGSASFVGSGVVDGHMHDRFSLDEFEGYLRVATTERTWDEQAQRIDSTNHLLVLQDRGDGTLAQVGAVRNFIRDEEIFSARFMGKRGYVVTFRQIDPLFSFDLSDPLAPRLGGEIEIPGFSSYIHPLRDDHLLTIGRGGDNTGADNTLQLQVFDVSALDDPRLLHTFTADIDGLVPEYAYSVASYDPHAFTYFTPQSLLSVPLSLVDNTAQSSFNGFLALQVDTQNGFSERSRVDHTDLGTLVFCGTGNDDPALCNGGQFLWYLTPLRTVVMTDADGAVFLYTVSNVGVKATSVDNAGQSLGTLIF